MFETTRRAFFTRGMLTRAIACVDGAIWDLVGKSKGQPLSRVWGGCPHRARRGRAGDELARRLSEAEFGKAIERLRADGIGGCKFKVGPQSPLGIDGDAKRMNLAREVGGDDFIMIADANQGWTVDEAIRFARSSSR